MLATSGATVFYRLRAVGVPNMGAGRQFYSTLKAKKGLIKPWQTAACSCLRLQPAWLSAGSSTQNFLAPSRLGQTTQIMKARPPWVLPRLTSWSVSYRRRKACELTTRQHMGLQK